MSLFQIRFAIKRKGLSISETVSKIDRLLSGGEHRPHSDGLRIPKNRKVKNNKMQEEEVKILFENESEFKRQFAQLLASKRETPNGVILQDVIDGSFTLVNKALNDFPFNIYFDNAIGGENHYTFYLKNNPEGDEVDIDEITREVAEWLERWFIGKKDRKGLHLVNPDKKTKIGKPLSAGEHR